MSNLAKVHRPKVYIELDRPRAIEYKLRAFARMEEKYGSIDAAMNAMESGSIEAISFMLWCGLVHEDPELTLEQVQDMVDIRDMEYVADKMGQVMNSDMPKKEDIPNN